VAEVSRVTHNTGLAIAGASAVAAAVSAGISGAGLGDALDAGVAAAERGAAFGEYAAGADVADRIRWALSLVAGRSAPGALEVVSRLVGTSVATQESVPAALALASLMPDGDPWLVLRAAASLGGDSDTIAAMAGAVCGAVAGARAFPMTALADLADANPELDLGSLADHLFALRGRSDGVP
jgi:ADP-ribosylglycohydrolase